MESVKKNAILRETSQYGNLFQKYVKLKILKSCIFFQQLLITLEDFEADEVQIRVKDFYLGNEESAYEFFYKDNQSVVSSVNDNWYTDQIPSSGTPFLTEAFCANSIYTGNFKTFHYRELVILPHQNRIIPTEGDTKSTVAPS